MWTRGCFCSPLAISLLTGLIFGALPALRSVRSAPMETLKSAGRGNTEGRGGLRVRNVLVSLEVGLSAALLVTAGLLIASFSQLMSVDRGFQVERILAMNVSLLSTKYPKPAERNAFFQRVLAKAAATAGRAERFAGIGPAADGRNLDRHRGHGARHAAHGGTALHQRALYQSGIFPDPPRGSARRAAISKSRTGTGWSASFRRAWPSACGARKIPWAASCRETAACWKSSA